MAVTPGTATAVARATETVVASYPMASDKFKGFVGSGTCEAVWRVYAGGVFRYTYRTSASDRNAYLLVPDDPITTATVVDVKVTHYETATQSFEATIITG